MKPLTVNCTITWQDCSSEPTVTWCKLLINNDCVKVNSTPDVAIHQERSLTEGNKIVSYLNFHRVEKHDDGLYRCEISGSLTVVSHTINVSVSGKSNDPTVFTWCTVLQATIINDFKLHCLSYVWLNYLRPQIWISVNEYEYTYEYHSQLKLVLICVLSLFVLFTLLFSHPCGVRNPAQFYR